MYTLLKQKASLNVLILLAIYFVSNIGLANTKEISCGPQIGCADLVDQAKKHGPIILIVSIHVPDLENLEIKSQMSTQEKNEIEKQRNLTITEIKNQVFARIALHNNHIKLRHKYEGLSSFSVQADAAGISYLLNDPDVLQLTMDTPTFISLSESTPLVGAPIAWEQGFTGDGYTIAILDTGVDKNHPFLLDKVVAEACFSTTAVGEDPIYGPWTTTGTSPSESFKISFSTMPNSVENRL